MSQDPEILAMSNVLNAVSHLNNWQRKRIIDWVNARFKLDDFENFGPEEAMPVVTVQQPLPQPPQAATPPAPPAPVAETQPAPQAAPAPKAAPAASTGPRQLSDFNTVIDLFSEAKVKKVSHKIILMAAYLQVKLDFKEVTSYEINSRLNRIGHKVSNITSSINAILKKEPPLFMISGKSSDKKQARRRFQLTETGMELAKSFLK